jgi:hypothetical protein
MFVEDKPLTLPRTHPTQPRTGGDVLLAGARFIEEHGWSPRGHERDLDRWCPIEAINAVSEYGAVRNEAFDLLSRQCGEWTITRWNRASTEDEVIATMRAAANA